MPIRAADPTVAAEQTKSDIESLRTALRALRAKAHDRKDFSKEKLALESVRQRMEQSDRDTVEKMREVSTYLNGKGVPRVILQRQEQVAKRIADQSRHFQSALAAVQNLDNAAAVESATQQLETEAGAVRTGRKAAPLDPHNLPFGRPKAAPRKAATTTAMMQEQHPDMGRRILFAGTGGAGVTAQLSPSDPSYIAANGEVQITQAIKNQAAALHNNPVEIFNWVRNNVDYIPTYGAIQGSDLTLQSLRGNAYDTAGLLIALLRAAGTPARYAYGSVQIPIAPLMNWAGGFDNAQAAVDFMGQGGIPITALATGGTIQAARIEHVWVEAWVAYQPGRGAKSTGGFGWAPMDASFKHYQDVAGIAPTTATSDVQAAAQSYLASATTGDGGAWSTNYNPGAFDGYRNSAAATLNQSITADPSPVLANQVLPARAIVTSQSPVLPATLPYHLVARGGDYAALPDSLKVIANIQLYAAEDETFGGSPLINQQISLPEEGFSSLELTYSPASAADASAWAAYQTPGTTEFPAYLINVKASLKLAGTDLQDSGAMGFGQDMVLHVVYGGAAQSRDARFPMLSGDEVQIGLNGGGVSPNWGKAAFSDPNALGTVETNLFVAAQTAWMQADLMDSQIARVSRVAVARMPSAAAVSSPVSIVYNFGIPYRASYHGHAVDIKLAQYSAMSRDGDPQKTRTFSMVSGMQLSSIEDTALEVVFSSPLGKGVSSMGLIALANASGMRIYHLTSTNWTTYRSVLQHSSDVLTDIDNAIGSGLEVVIPQSQQSNGGWTGSGYIILDPVTGSGDYRISGGASGSFTDSCGRQTEPVTIKVPEVSVIWDMLLYGLVDDDLNFNGAGVAAVLALVAATAVLVIVAGPAALAAAATVGRAAATAALVLSLGVSTLAEAAEDDCSCTPKSVPPRGGNAFHDACASLPQHTSFPGVNRLLTGRYYDGELEPLRQMTEVKTGTFYSIIAGIADGGSHSALSFKASLLLKEEGLIVTDEGIAGVCKFDYGYYAVDGRLVGDLQEILGTLAGKAHPTSCGP
jgi:transglutaminase-like putative cysteine protease